MEGMKAAPGSPLGYVGEGKVFPIGGKQYNEAKFPLTEELKAKGLQEKDWVTICAALRKGKGLTGFGAGFSKAIARANEDYLLKIGCIGVYAEYGKGQKCMVVLDKETQASMYQE